ncbi:hypothetical protein ACV354_30275, partial [Pseudomonas aeruginosa]
EVSDPGRASSGSVAQPARSTARRRGWGLARWLTSAGSGVSGASQVSCSAWSGSSGRRNPAAGWDTCLHPDTPLPALISLLAKPQPNLRSVALAGFVNKPEADGPECLTPA